MMDRPKRSLVDWPLSTVKESNRRSMLNKQTRSLLNRPTTLLLDRPRRSLIDSIIRTFPIKQFIWKEISKRKMLRSENKLQRRNETPSHSRFVSLNDIANVRYNSNLKHS